MTHRLALLIIINFLIAANSCIAMNESNNNIITKPIFCFFPDNNTVFIGGKQSYGIFDSRSKNLIFNGIEQLQSSSAQIHTYAAHKNILVIVYNNTIRRANIFNMSEGKYTLKDYLWPQHPNNNIALNNGTIFSHDRTLLTSYDYHIDENLTTSTFLIPYDNSAHDYPRISCHPTKNEVLYPCCIDKLSIAQSGYTPIIKTILSCTGKGVCYGEYNPNGTVIAIREYANQYYIYNIERNDDYALELAMAPSNERYIDMAFDPRNCLLALLSYDGIVQYWDYALYTLIGTTHTLSKKILCNSMYWLASYKRLAFSPNGKQLAVALEDEWCIIDVPQKNLFTIFLMLKKNQLPSELIQLIVQNVFSNGATLSHLNSVALEKVAPLPDPIPEQYDVPQQETERRGIQLIRQADIMKQNK